jgi:rod shape-determining protein MreD
VKTAGVLAALAVALALQTTLARFSIGGNTVVDLVLVVVVYAALSGGPLTGMLAGVAGGLVQDALGGGLVGVGGLAKTLVGFAAGVVGAQFIVAQPVSRFVVFFVATLVHAACFYGLYALIEPRGFPAVAALTQAVGNGLVGVAAFQVAGLIAGGPRPRRGRGRFGRRA